jgi:Luciferase-like monooxygenase
MEFWSGTAFMKRSEYVAVARMFDEAGYDGIVYSDHMIYPRELWRGGWVSWSGQYYHVPELMIEPHPQASVPILCGGESEAALRRAARLCVERFREPIERFAEDLIAKVRS